MNGWRYYGTEKLQVVPYMEGTPVFQDGVLSSLYYRTRDEGKLSKALCGDVLTHDAFVSFFHLLRTLQVLCEVEENKDLKPVGYSWVSSPKGVDGVRSAHGGFCFFNKPSKPSVPRDLARLGLAYWMVDLKINVIHGIQLESNYAARNFAHRLGFSEIAVVPDYHYVVEDGVGKLVGARVMALKDEVFLPQFEKWRAFNPLPDNHVAEPA